jgi:hypothetical protein
MTRLLHLAAYALAWPIVTVLGVLDDLALAWDDDRQGLDP